MVWKLVVMTNVHDCIIKKEVTDKNCTQSYSTYFYHYVLPPAHLFVLCNLK